MRAFFLFAAAALSLGAACTSVDLGTPPADVNACRPGQQFFVDTIWPEVFDKDYSGKRCADGGCHGPATTTQMRFVPVPPLAAGQMVPIPLMGEWASNYISASENMNCTDVQGSALLRYPTAIVVHAGGKLFDRNSPEAGLLAMWVTQP